LAVGDFFVESGAMGGGSQGAGVRGFKKIGMKKRGNWGELPIIKITV